MEIRASIYIYKEGEIEREREKERVPSCPNFIFQRIVINTVQQLFSFIWAPAYQREKERTKERKRERERERERENERVTIEHVTT